MRHVPAETVLFFGFFFFWWHKWYLYFLTQMILHFFETNDICIFSLNVKRFCFWLLCLFGSFFATWSRRIALQDFDTAQVVNNTVTESLAIKACTWRLEDESILVKLSLSVNELSQTLLENEKSKIYIISLLFWYLFCPCFKHKKKWCCQRLPWKWSKMVPREILKAYNLFSLLGESSKLFLKWLNVKARFTFQSLEISRWLGDGWNCKSTLFVESSRLFLSSVVWSWMLVVKRYAYFSCLCSPFGDVTSDRTHNFCARFGIWAVNHFS